MKIEDLKKLLEEATPGPWEADGWFVEKDKKSILIAECGGPPNEDEENAALIAAAVNALPRLLRVAEAAREVRRTLPCIDRNPAGCGKCLVCRLDAALAEVES